MMLTLTPINLVQAPNHWMPLGTIHWTVTANVATSLWGLLQIQDSMGQRPYIPASGSTMTAVFQRGDMIGGGGNVQTTTKTAILNTNFRAIAEFQLTSQDATNITSGTVVFTLFEGGTEIKWAQNWACKKLNTTAGF